MATAVLAISDQTVQNVQFVKEFADKIEHYWFVTTEKMEKKGCSDWICKTLQLKENLITKILVDEFSLPDIQEKLQTHYQESSQNYLVNITGGTKLMSLAIHEFFKIKPNATIYYLTGEDNQILTLSQNGKKTLQSRLSLEEYLNSYGIILRETSQRTAVYSFELAQRIYQEFLKREPAHIQCLQELRDYIQEKNKKAKEVIVETIQGLRSFLDSVDFPYDNYKIFRKDADYLTGKWLEEYAYHCIKQQLKLSDKEIAMGLYLQKKGIENTENDFDVMYVFQNKLFVVECKTSHKVDGKNKLTEYIYKLDSLQKELGLFARSFIYTLGDLPTDANQQKQIKDRLKFHRITLLTKAESSIENTMTFGDWLNSLQKDA
ncbi:MAG: DUF1887 family CARF protein [Raineya sp.]|nr:DUF1887 family CARF protein [Raineya sp.]